MIIETFLNQILGVFTYLFYILPDLPSFPSDFLNSVNYVLDVIFSNLNLLGIFIRIDTIKITVPVLIAILNFDRIYMMIKWIINKIPFVDLD